jgi:hypothetical integral membrane protein (TIGR02206 family)
MHAAAVTCVVAVIVATVLVARAWRGTRRENALAWTIAGAIVALRAGVFAWNLMPSRISLATSLPLQICDLAALCSAVALVSRGRFVAAIAYFWGLALSIQGLLQPDLAGGPHSLSFWLFWLHHALIVGAAMYLVAVRDFRPTLRDLLMALGAGVVYVAVVFLIDMLLGVNYGYLGQALPSQPTLLDWLGPWPWRVLVMVALGVAAMSLLLVPFAGRGRGQARSTKVMPRGADHVAL